MAHTTAALPPVAEVAERIPAMPGGNVPSREEIAAVVAMIAERFRPEQIVLFGSRAYGVPTEESDVDLMVVTDVGHRPAEILAAIGAAFPFPRASYDVKVRTTAQIRLGLAERDFFVLDVVERGVALLGEDAGREWASHEVAAAGDGTVIGSAGLKEATRGWLVKADECYQVARRFMEPPDPLPDHACFYARESVEAHLKAHLQEREIRSPRTGDLPALAELAGMFDGAALVAPSLLTDLRWLSQFTSDISYPGWTGDPADLARALGIAADLRARVRVELGLGAADEGER